MRFRGVALRLCLAAAHSCNADDRYRSSNHDSPNYGRHYTAEEVIDIFAPSKETVDSVRGWLENAGITASRISQSANKQWLQFDAKVEEVEALLHTEYHAYEHKDTGKFNFACEK